MKKLSPFFVRLGIFSISVLVALKAFALSIVRLFAKLLSPFARFFLEYIILPVYGLIYALQRRLNSWYRPAKNRLMFFLSNRYSIHGVVIVIALVAVGVNLRFDTVRAETGTFGERSLLYGIVTKQSVEVIEEYAGSNSPETYGTNSYLGDSTLRTTVGDNTTAAAVPSSTLLAEGILSTPTTSSITKETIAPREGNVTHTVANGETLSTIAEKYSISLNTLLWANGLSVRSVIKPGSTLTILPTTGVQHTVAKGDTLLGIAKKYNVSADEILAYNKLSSSSALTVGGPLIIPGGEIQAPTPVTRTIAVSKIFTAPPATSSASTAKPAAGKMIWPTDLRTIVRGLSWYHTGYDIDCDGHKNGSSTNDNYAAADGIVQFAGVKGGYGNAIEINHGNGIVTRYGHFYALYVQKGESVTAGTPLGRCGSTGNSTGTHLHFEVIVNGKFKNPYDYIR
jgi:LysM repeat protein